jgi:aspartate aminotransferase-like enzyme
VPAPARPGDRRLSGAVWPDGRPGAIPAYYADILRWLPIMKDPARYFSTPCVNEIRAFREALRLVLEEGVEQRFRRHDATGRAMRAALSTLGFSFFTDPRFLAPTLSVPQYPAGVEDRAFRQTLFENGVVVAGGLAHTAGKVFRMGHMGNLSPDDVKFVCEALETTLRSLVYRLEPERPGTPRGRTSAEHEGRKKPRLLRPGGGDGARRGHRPQGQRGLSRHRF